MTVPSADGPLESGDGSAPVATSADTERPLTESDATTMPSSGTTPATPPSTVSGPFVGSSEPGPTTGSPSTSRNSGERSSGSTRRWRQPRNVREFAAQANAVATLVLNGEMGLEAARTYSSVARTVAQAMSTEVSRSRFLQSEPSLDLPDDVWEDDDT